MSTPSKNPALACFLSVLWPGLGQVYNGQTMKAFCFMIIALVTVLIALYVSLPFFIYAAYDAYSTAKKVNSGKLTPY
jgi:TM2 domain-containing membrane protein YozV